MRNFLIININCPDLKAAWYKNVINICQAALRYNFFLLNRIILELDTGH